MALKRLKAASEASSSKATQISAKTIFSTRFIYVTFILLEADPSFSNTE